MRVEDDTTAALVEKMLGHHLEELSFLVSGIDFKRLHASLRSVFNEARHMAEVRNRSR